MVETRRGKRKENPTIVQTNEAEKKNRKKKKKTETSEEPTTVTDGVLSEPINVLAEAAAAVGKEGSQPSKCSPISSSGASPSKEEEGEDASEQELPSEHAGSDEETEEEAGGSEIE